MRRRLNGSLAVLAAALLFAACGDDDSDETSTDVVDDDTAEEVADIGDGMPDTSDGSYAGQLASDDSPITGVYELTTYRDLSGDCEATDTATPPATYFAIKHIDQPNFSIERFELVLCDTVADCEGASTASGISGAADSEDASSLSAQVAFNPSQDTCTINSADVKSVVTTDDGVEWSIESFDGPVEITDVESPSAPTCREEAEGVLDQMTCVALEQYEGTLVTE
jgi:hypothetical protein